MVSVELGTSGVKFTILRADDREMLSTVTADDFVISRYRVDISDLFELLNALV